MSGKHKEILKPGTSRSTVIAEIGPPLRSVVSPDPSVVLPAQKPIAPDRSGMDRLDTYHTKEVIPDWANATGAEMAFVMTLGLSELIIIPLSIRHLVPCEKKLIIYYDEMDRLQRYYLANDVAAR